MTPQGQGRIFSGLRDTSPRSAEDILRLKGCLLLLTRELRWPKGCLLLLTRELRWLKGCLLLLTRELRWLEGCLLLLTKRLLRVKEDRREVHQVLPGVSRGLHKEKAGGLLLEEALLLDPQGSPKRTPQFTAV